jgi:hypothetical protein
MTLEENKAIIRRAAEELFNKGDLALADPLYVPGYAEHERRFTGMIPPVPDLQLS